MAMNRTSTPQNIHTFATNKNVSGIETIAPITPNMIARVRFNFI